MSLEQIPLRSDIDAKSPYMNRRLLEADGRAMMKKLLDYLSSAHITSVNLMTIMQSCARLARTRQGFMVDVLRALEAVHANLPPTLSPSQVRLMIPSIFCRSPPCANR